MQKEARSPSCVTLTKQAQPRYKSHQHLLLSSQVPSHKMQLHQLWMISLTTLPRAMLLRKFRYARMFWLVVYLASHLMQRFAEAQKSIGLSTYGGGCIGFGSVVERLLLSGHKLYTLVLLHFIWRLAHLVHFLQAAQDHAEDVQEQAESKSNGASPTHGSQQQAAAAVTEEVTEAAPEEHLGDSLSVLQGAKSELEEPEALQVVCMQTDQCCCCCCCCQDNWCQGSVFDCL